MIDISENLHMIEGSPTRASDASPGKSGIVKAGFRCPSVTMGDSFFL
ncbi:MAG: hypothetical protein AAGF33_01570 [Pseudomonadota bacterium]